jgi:hypothetical protein
LNKNWRDKKLASSFRLHLANSPKALQDLKTFYFFCALSEAETHRKKLLKQVSKNLFCSEMISV